MRLCSKRKGQIDKEKLQKVNWNIHLLQFFFWFIDLGVLKAIIVNWSSHRESVSMINFIELIAF